MPRVGKLMDRKAARRRLTMLEQFGRGTRWRSRFNGGEFVVVDEFDGHGRMRVLWDSSPRYLADVWEHDLRPLQLELVKP